MSTCKQSKLSLKLAVITIGGCSIFPRTNPNDPECDRSEAACAAQQFDAGKPLVEAENDSGPRTFFPDSGPTGPRAAACITTHGPTPIGNYPVSSDIAASDEAGIVAWTENSAAHVQLFGRTLDLEPSIRLTADGASDISATRMGDGWVACWRAERMLKCQRVGTDGSPVGALLSLSVSAFKYTILGSSSGLLVAWTMNQDSQKWSVAARKFNTDLTSPSDLSVTTVEGNEPTISLANAGEGTALLAVGFSSAFAPIAFTIDANGQIANTPIKFPATTTQKGYIPAFATSIDDAAVVAWGVTYQEFDICRVVGGTLGQCTYFENRAFTMTAAVAIYENIWAFGDRKVAVFSKKASEVVAVGQTSVDPLRMVRVGDSAAFLEGGRLSMLQCAW